MSITGTRNLRGMLLEEALLRLLTYSGYVVVDDDSNDDTLTHDQSGLVVNGRGGQHQIDAISDFFIQAPFSHRSRLLLEAKCYAGEVGIPIIRQAVGTLIDVSQFWSSANNDIHTKRYSYQYAVFSSSGFSKDAQKYAFAQDIYLLSLKNVPQLALALQSITSIAAEDIHISDPSIQLKHLRKDIRASLRGEHIDFVTKYGEPFAGKLSNFISHVNDVGEMFLGTFNGGFSVLLAPADEIKQQVLAGNIPLSQIIRANRMRIYRQDNYWVIADEADNVMFNFQIPVEYLHLFYLSGAFDQRMAAQNKMALMNTLQIPFYDKNRRRLEIVVLHIDTDWIDHVIENSRL